MFRTVWSTLALLVLLLAVPALADDTQDNPFVDPPPKPAVRVVKKPDLPATVGIMGGEIDGTFMRVATDLTSVMNSDTFRVIPIVGKGSLQNIGDVLNLKGVDLALIASDALTYAKDRKLYPGQLDKVQYIAKLYDNELHVLARKDIRSLQDLAGQTVNIDVEGSGTALTSGVMFKALGIDARLTNEEPGVGLEKLKRGEIAAITYAVGKPGRLFTGIPAGSDLHLLTVPLDGPLAQTYLPGRFTHADYPNLIGNDESVDTIAVGVALGVFNWAPGSDRYRNVVQFIDQFFSRFPELLKPPHHPKWHDVNLQAQVPGWQRFQPATDWLARHAPPQQIATADAATQEKFAQFLKVKGVALTTDQQAQLFRSFTAWLSEQR